MPRPRSYREFTVLCSGGLPSLVIGASSSFSGGMIMRKTAPLPAAQRRSWKDLVEVGIFETHSDNLSKRIQDAQNAIMDEIKDCFQSASPSERQALVNAMNAVRELKRLSDNRDGPMRKRSAVLTRPPNAVPAFRAGGQEACSARRPSVQSERHGAQDKTLPTLQVGVIDCPYCDGENVISRNARKFVGREIACRYCQCLFLLSESKDGIRPRSPQSDASKRCLTQPQSVDVLPVEKS